MSVSALSRSLRRSAFVLLLAAPLALLGCDPTVGAAGENVTLAPRTRAATFDFDCNGRPAGQAVALTSSQTMTFAGAGNLDGFQPSDVVSATVTGVMLRRDIPSGVLLGTMLRTVSVSLVGAQTVEIGSVATLPAAAAATMTASAADVGAIVRGAPFRARLDGTVVTTRNDDCRIEATMTFRVVVKGF